jgi:hypothetical protein
MFTDDNVGLASGDNLTNLVFYVNNEVKNSLLVLGQ